MLLVAISKNLRNADRTQLFCRPPEKRLRLLKRIKPGLLCNAIMLPFPLGLRNGHNKFYYWVGASQGGNGIFPGFSRALSLSWPLELGGEERGGELRSKSAEQSDFGIGQLPHAPEWQLNKLTEARRILIESQVKILSAIVLLLWAVCYGRCLGEQYGFHSPEKPQEQWCTHQCCQEEKKESPVQTPVTLCGVCDFIKDGGTVQGGTLALEVPVFFCVPFSGSAWFTAYEQLISDPVEELAPDTGPPFISRMCEWMASTAAPVRGPDCRA